MKRAIHTNMNQDSIKEAAKKGSSTNGQAIKRGGGVKAGPLRKKYFFLNFVAI